jgi:hypothetical protein
MQNANRYLVENNITNTAAITKKISQEIANCIKNMLETKKEYEELLNEALADYQKEVQLGKTPQEAKKIAASMARKKKIKRLREKGQNDNQKIRNKGVLIYVKIKRAIDRFLKEKDFEKKKKKNKIKKN